MSPLQWASRAQAPNQDRPQVYFDNSWPCSDPDSGRPATCGLGGATDSCGLEPPEGKRPTTSFLTAGNRLPPWSTEPWGSWGSGGFVPLMVMHGSTNSLHEAVNSGAAAAAAPPGAL